VAERITSKNKDARVIIEESFQTPAGTLKPDLVVTDRGRVHMVDVTIGHKVTGYLQGGYHDKVSKYSLLLQLVAEKFNTTLGKVLPIVIGTWGTIPKNTISSLNELQIHDRKSYITISLLAFRSSIELYHTFLDYDTLRV
jgi:hypothetical protein